jgi:hypothetical protein
MPVTSLDARITEADKLMPDSSPKSYLLIRKLLPYTTVAAGLALIYMGWVFYSRASVNRELQREADQKSVEQAQKTYELYGSGQLKVLLFYATPSTIARGQSTQLCYSVSNATAVKIDQGIEEIKPSLNHCVPAKPVHSTTYTISASDEKGHQASQSINVRVR